MAESEIGKLIGLYALTTSPTFEVARALTLPSGSASSAIFDTCRRNPAPSRRIFLDISTTEGGGGWPEARQLHDLLVERGYRPGHSLVYVEDEGADHHEGAWARRIRETLPYLVAGRHAGQATKGPDVEA